MICVVLPRHLLLLHFYPDMAAELPGWPGGKTRRNSEIKCHFIFIGTYIAKNNFVSYDDSTHIMYNTYRKVGGGGKIVIGR